jgi:hypothetical protein
MNRGRPRTDGFREDFLKTAAGWEPAFHRSRQVMRALFKS